MHHDPGNTVQLDPLAKGHLCYNLRLLATLVWEIARFLRVWRANLKMDDQTAEPAGKHAVWCQQQRETQPNISLWYLLF